MKHLLIALLLIVGIQLSYSQDKIRDTVESGSSDSTKWIRLYEPAHLIAINFWQLDTNGTTVGGTPDSLKLWWRCENVTTCVDFRQSSGDSLKNPIIFSPLTVTQRSGYINQPAITEFFINMANLKYVTNRRIYYEVYVLY